MTAARRPTFALVALLAFAAASRAAPGEEGPAPGPATDPDALRAAMDRLWLEATADHARSRRPGYEPSVRAFAGVVRRAVVAAAEETPRIPDGRRRTVADAIASDATSEAASPPFGVRTLSFLLSRTLPEDLAGFVRDHDVAWFEVFLTGEARSLFAADRFEDAWDAVFRDAPEVAAWRAAHATAGGPPGPGAERPGGPADGARAPAPGALPDLVCVDAAEAWVGTWTGWTSDLRERDDRRQKRPAKTIWIQRREVTCGEYLAYLRTLDAERRAAALPTGWTVDAAGDPAHPEGADRHPVGGVTWAQATRYAESLGMRLPTEDEWDRAAAGGAKEGRTFPWGASAEGRRWGYLGTAGEAPSAVDAWPDDVTPSGIAGLAGNVAELTSTLADRRDVPRTGPAAGDQIVVRGGSFRARESECVNTFRRLIDAGRSAPHVGFRCVMEDAEYRRRVREAEARR